MKISIITNNFSESSYHRPYVLANALKKRFEVEMVGPMFGSKIYPPCHFVEGIDIKTVKASWYPNFHHQKNNILRSISGDVIIASKVTATSLGIALQMKNIPIMVDIDDYTVGNFLGNWNNLFLRLAYNIIKNPFRLLNPQHALYNILIEKKVNKVNQVFCTNTVLQRRYGGVILPHARDPEEFNPARYDQQKLKSEFGLDKFFIIGFLGNPSPHKGVFETINTLIQIGDRQIKLFFVGADRHNKYTRLLQRKAGDFVVFLYRKVALAEVPKYLAATDLVILNQQKTVGSNYQVPAKLIDAMAMAKPTIVSNVGDLPGIVEDGGLVVRWNMNEDLLRAILEIKKSPELARELGDRARKKFLKCYTYQNIEKIITDAINRNREVFSEV